LLATLPGLPMFAHGQVEGLRERYGMEYRQAYLDEGADPALIADHERRIAPLLARRRVFADAERFRLYELEARGNAAEQVLVFSNGEGHDLHLVASNLGPASARGTVDRSTPFRPAEGASPTTGRLRDLLPPGAASASELTARDLATGEQLTWAAAMGPGLTLDLAPWQARVLTDFAWRRALVAAPEAALRSGWWRRLWERVERLWRRLHRRR
jgi:hypothetical protein